MRIFLTGATGFIGSKLVPELINAGHEVLGLARTDEGAARVSALGATAHRGAIDDLESLTRGAAVCDGVIHTAFDHNFANFVENCEKDARAIQALGSALKGTSRPLVITSTTAMGTSVPGQAADEDQFNPDHPNPRVASELAGRELLEAGINVSVVRLSQIHNTIKQGLVTEVIELARRKNVSAFVDGGQNRWSAAHVFDAAHLFRLALEEGAAGARYHATAEEGIEFAEIAKVIGHTLDIPVVSIPSREAAEHFGWLTGFVGKDMSALSEKTRKRLDWTPVERGLLDDLANA